MHPSAENLRFFAHTNAEAVRGPVRGLVIDHMGLGSQWTADGLTARDLDFAARGLLFMTPYNGPWSWMNDAAIAATDLFVSLLFERFSLPADTPLCSTGGSMGGLAALVHARYTKHRLAAVAVNCPVCDLPFHVTERPDLPRTLWSAFGDAPDFDAALRAHSPLHLAPSMPDVPYTVVHSTDDKAVSKAKHADPFVAALRAAGRRVRYVVSEGTGHCDLRADARAAYDEAVSAAFDTP